MSTQYKLRIFSKDYQPRTEVYDFLSVYSRKTLNDPGELTFTLNGKHPAITGLEHQGILELWRKNDAQGLDWSLESRSLFLNQSKSNQAGQETFTTTCFGPEWILSTRVVAYPADVNGRYSQADVPGNIARRLVSLNAGSAATVGNGRLRDGVIPGLAVELQEPRGTETVILWACGGENLLGTLQRLAQESGQDFYLEFLTSPLGWEFHWRGPGKESDQTGSVKLSLGLGTLAEPVYALERKLEKTVCIVEGPPTAGVYPYEVVTGEDYAVDNDLEVFTRLEADQVATMLEMAGYRLLAKKRSRPQLRFAVRQTPGLVYGRDYMLGDLVTASYGGATLQPVVQQVELRLESDHPEQIRVVCQTR